MAKVTLEDGSPIELSKHHVTEISCDWKNKQDKDVCEVSMADGRKLQVIGTQKKLQKELG